MMSLASLGNDLYTGRRQFNIVGRRALIYGISGVLLALSLVGIFGRGLNYGLEFKGGVQVRVPGVSQMDNLESRSKDAVHRATGDDVQVSASSIGTDVVRVQTPEIGTGELNDPVLDKTKAELAKEFNVPADQVTATTVSSSWGDDVTKKAINALIWFLVLVSLVLAVYFRTWKMALSALVALAHDLVFTVGAYALIGFEVTPASVIGFLTILGYSLYDTVVVFDKVRENTDDAFQHGRYTFAQAANHAVNQTLVRSINTSVVALLPVAAILAVALTTLGEGTLLDLSLALFIGIAIGTYSSIFVATPMLVQLREGEAEIKRHDAKVLKWQAQHGIPGWGAGGTEVHGSSVPGAAGVEDDAALAELSEAEVDLDQPLRGAGSTRAGAATAARTGAGEVRSGARAASTERRTVTSDTTPTGDLVGGRQLHPHARTGPRNQPRRQPKSKR